jgi:Leucine-rich repeat (LRR) protein
LNFLKKFQNLKYLNLSFNALKDISALKDITTLQDLILRGNQVDSVPELDKMSSLNYLDLSGNSIKDITPITSTANLNFLNLSGNQIEDISTLSGQKNLKFLNLSNNSLNSATLKPIPSLKVLNLNGATSTNIKINLNADLLSFQKKELSKTLLADSLNNDFYSSRLKNCETKPAINEEISFDGFENLEVLSLNNNQIRNFPNISSLKKLRYLSLERNLIRDVPELSEDSELEFLDLSVNKLVSVPVMKVYSPVIDVMSNDITEVPRLPRGAILAGNNLIQNLNDFDDNEAVAALDLRGNPFVGVYCAEVNYGYSAQFCPEKDKFPDRNVIKPEGIDFMTWHESKKCPLNE